MGSKIKLFILIAMFLVSINIVSALPDLIIEDIEFYQIQDGSMELIPPDGGTTYLTMDSLFSSRPALKNIGATETNKRIYFTSYLDGVRFATTQGAACFSCPTGYNLSPVVIGSSYNVIHIGPGQSLSADWMSLGQGITTSPAGYHNLTIVVNDDNPVGGDYFLNQRITESDYANNFYEETIYTGPLPPNNPPEITSVSSPSSVIEEYDAQLEFSFTDMDGMDDIHTIKISIDGDVKSIGSNSYLWSTTPADAGFHNITFFVNDTNGAYDEVNETIEVVHPLENNELDDIAIPLYTYFDLNDNGPLYNLTFDYDAYIGSTSPSIEFNADRYTEDEQMGDEYMDENSHLTESQAEDLNEITYGSVSKPTWYCYGPEYTLPVNPTTLAGYNYTLTDYFCYMENICFWLFTNNPECNDPWAPQIYDYSPKTNPTINNASSQTFSIIARDTNEDQINLKWYLDGELVKSDSLASGIGGLKNYTLVGNVSLIGTHRVRVVISDPSLTEDLDEFNFPTTKNWKITIT